jgi:DGQHR domain-containing protein
MPDHVRTIKGYLDDNKEAYILPPVTLNIRQVPQLFVPVTNAAVRSGFLVVPDETVFYVTDGQHRIAAISGFQAGNKFVAGVLDEDPERGADGLAVLIVVEENLVRIHQDFADAAQTKQIPASLLAAYNMREPINRVLHRIVNESELLKGRIDETSKTLPKLSQNLFLLNQVRGMIKELLVGDYGLSDDALSRVAEQRLGRVDLQDSFVRQTLQLLEVLATKMDPWDKIAQLPIGGAQANQIPDFRQEFLNLTATGLVILGHTAYEINKQKNLEADRLEAYSKLATEIDWHRSAALWQGTVMTPDGKLVTSRVPVKAAKDRVTKALRLELPANVK